jgi:hypothetical protein
VVYVQQFGFFVPDRVRAERRDFLNDLRHQFWMAFPQPPVFLDEAEINSRIIADHPVGVYQCPEAMTKGSARWQVFRCVNQDARNASVFQQHGAQMFQHLGIGIFPAAGQNDFLRLQE